MLGNYLFISDSKNKHYLVEPKLFTIAIVLNQKNAYLHYINSNVAQTLIM